MTVDKMIYNINEPYKCSAVTDTINTLRDKGDVQALKNWLEKAKVEYKRRQETGEFFMYSLENEIAYLSYLLGVE